jgi:hypothetical protein
MAPVPAKKTTGEQMQGKIEPSAGNLEAAGDSRSPGPAGVKSTLAPQSAQANLGHCLRNLTELVKPGTCIQKIWFSFFFDGTGNNLNADLGNDKHSNVAKLFRAHFGDENLGGVATPDTKPYPNIHRVYIPGVGTYFFPAADEGGSNLGLGTAARGESRLEWALKEFDSYMKKHAQLANNPVYAIEEINVAVFGFSRGAAAARAFTNDFVRHRCTTKDGKLVTKDGKYTVRIRFLGLFDTVASVGIPMSSNNLDTMDALKGNTKSHIHKRLNLLKFYMTTPHMLAFAAGAAPGADPSPGDHDGHMEWGGRMAIPQCVENVTHMIAGHEQRNSFPVDSICIADKEGKWQRPAHWNEYVYAGVHSDVGGSYAPGEGGKNVERETKYGLVPLAHMYDLAIQAGVPLKPRSAWNSFQQADFGMLIRVVKDYDYYCSQLGPAGSVGGLIVEHMRMYFKWRFHKIRSKGMEESAAIGASEKQFQETMKPLTKEDRRLKAVFDRNVMHRNLVKSELASVGSSDFGGSERVKAEKELARLNGEIVRSYKEWRETAAKIHSVPKTAELSAYVTFFDEQLLRDVQSIYDDVKNPENAGRRAVGYDKLRPFYKAMVDAYQAEYFDNAGLKDLRVIEFFDKYIHNSIAGFGADATLPSDPRVIYAGGDFKGKYARNSNPHSVDHIV